VGVSGDALAVGMLPVLALFVVGDTAAGATLSGAEAGVSAAPQAANTSSKMHRLRGCIG
jgi:hypothetical protein